MLCLFIYQKPFYLMLGFSLTVLASSIQNANQLVCNAAYTYVKIPVK